MLPLGAWTSAAAPARLWLAFVGNTAAAAVSAEFGTSGCNTFAVAFGGSAAEGKEWTGAFLEHSLVASEGLIGIGVAEGRYLASEGDWKPASEAGFAGGQCMYTATLVESYHLPPPLA